MRLWREQRQQAIEAFVADLREKVKPEVHGDLVELVKVEDAPPGKGVPAAVPTPGETEAPEGPRDPHAE